MYEQYSTQPSYSKDSWLDQAKRSSAMKRYFCQRLVLALALAALVPSWSFGQTKLVVAIQPTVASDEMLNKAKPLQQFLEKGLGGKTKVEIYVPTSYAAVVE